MCSVLFVAVVWARRGWFCLAWLLVCVVLCFGGVGGDWYCDIGFGACVIAFDCK